MRDDTENNVMSICLEHIVIEGVTLNCLSICYNGCVSSMGHWFR